MARRIILIRHGELPEEFHGRYIGRTDAPLAEDAGIRYHSLRNLWVDKLYSSPLRRARETAGFIGGGMAYEVLDALGEIDFGAWDNRTYEEITRIADAELLRCWSETPDQMVFPGGESVASFQRRVDEAFAFLARDAAETVGAVTHGGVLMRILGLLHGLPTVRQFEVLPPRGSVTRLLYREGTWHEEE